jgi:hypothetical protein
MKFLVRKKAPRSDKPRGDYFVKLFHIMLFRELSKRRFACDTVSDKPFDSLEGFNRAFGACSKITVKTACVVATAN